MPIFEVMFIEEPTPIDAEDNGAMERIIMMPKCYVAADRDAAITQATMALTEVLSKSTVPYDKARLKALVRPFVTR